MNIQFNTQHLTSDEALGLIALLETLLPVSEQDFEQASPVPQPPSPKNEEEAIFGVPVQAEPAAPTSAPAQPEPTPITSKRTRRTKAEMEAAAKPQAAPADPTPASAVQTAEVSVTTQSATASKSTVSADELRALLNGYFVKHSVEEAIDQLKTFGCNRVPEALSLEPEKLNQLAEALRG